MIRSGRRLQNEITADSVAAGTASRPEFYRKNLKWSEGLISASKDIGRGAKLLVDSANAVVNEQVGPEIERESQTKNPRRKSTPKVIPWYAQPLAADENQLKSWLFLCKKVF